MSTSLPATTKPLLLRPVVKVPFPKELPRSLTDVGEPHLTTVKVRFVGNFRYAIEPYVFFPDEVKEVSVEFAQKLLALRGRGGGCCGTPRYERQLFEIA